MKVTKPLCKRASHDSYLHISVTLTSYINTNKSSFELLMLKLISNLHSKLLALQKKPGLTCLLKMENSDNKQKTANLEKKIVEKQPTSYQEWIQQAQVARNANWKLNVAIHESDDTKEPPKFDKVFKQLLS